MANVTVKAFIACAINFAHTASADPLEQAIVA